jgi:CubicO group peptidase (beta-lactamase class C family)
MKKEINLKLEKLINKYTKKVKGISVVLTNQENNIFEYCPGVIDDKSTPNNPSKMYSIGSNTKLLTAVSVFQLIDQNKLDLDEDIKVYIPEFEVQSHQPFDKITTRQLLMHRSGIQGDDYRLFFDETKTQKDDLLPAIKETYLCTTPGSMYAYSNLAYGLLGILIERLSGESYVDYVQKHIFNPLNLSMMILPTIEEREKHRGTISDGFDKKRKVNKNDLTTLISAGCSTYASTTDMAKFLRFFLNPKKQTILSKESMRKLLDTPPAGMYLKGERGHGLGSSHNFITYPNKKVGSLVGHGGATSYHFSIFQTIPKQGIGIAVMSNTEGSLAAIMKITRSVLTEYLQSIDIMIDPIEIPEAKILTTDLSKYEDSIITSGFKIPITLSKNGSLIAKIRLLKVKVLIGDDGLFRLQPKGIARLPFLSKPLRKMTVFRKEDNGLKVYYLKQFNENSYVINAIGSSQTKIENTERFRYLVGKYKRVTPFESKKNFAKTAKISVTDTEVIIKISLEGVTSNIYLNPVSKNCFINQGYGRLALSTILVNQESSDIFITLFGITMKKINKE